MRKRKRKKENANFVSYPERELTANTKWIVCMWDILGDPPEETAMVLKRSLDQVKEIISQSKEDGYYEKVDRHIKKYREQDSFVGCSELLNIGFSDEEVGEMKCQEHITRGL